MVTTVVVVSVVIALVVVALVVVTGAVYCVVTTPDFAFAASQNWSIVSLPPAEM